MSGALCVISVVLLVVSWTAVDGGKRRTMGTGWLDVIQLATGVAALAAAFAAGRWS